MMPRALRLILAFWPGLLFAYGYAGWRLYHALLTVLTSPPDHLVGYFIAGIAFLNLYPFVLLLLRLLQADKLRDAVGAGTRWGDVLLAYPFWFGVILVLEVVPWLMLLDFLKLPFYPLYIRLGTQWFFVVRHVMVVLFLGYAVYVLARVVHDTVFITVKKIRIRIGTLPAGVRDLRIVHVSDLHADMRTRTRKLSRYVRKINKLKPDVVFFTGDLVTSGSDHVAQAAKILGSIDAKQGVFACIGDHDDWAGREMVVQSLTGHGITVLQDTNRFVYPCGVSLLVTAITNIYQQRPNLDKLNFLMGQQPRGTLDIAITHQPSETLVELAAERGYHLLLAGHAHGGQIVLRPFGLPFTLAKFESPFYRGTRYVGRMLLNINNGLGLTLAPVRYHAPVEISLIRLAGRESR